MYPENFSFMWKMMISTGSGAGAARNDDLAFGGGCAHKRGQEVGPEGYILAADQQIETRAGIGHRGCAEVRPAPRTTGQK